MQQVQAESSCRLDFMLMFLHIKFQQNHVRMSEFMSICGLNVVIPKYLLGHTTSIVYLLTRFEPQHPGVAILKH